MKITEALYATIQASSRPLPPSEGELEETEQRLLISFLRGQERELSPLRNVIEEWHENLRAYAEVMKDIKHLRARAAGLGLDYDLHYTNSLKSTGANLEHVRLINRSLFFQNGGNLADPEKPEKFRVDALLKELADLSEREGLKLLRKVGIEWANPQSALDLPKSEKAEEKETLESLQAQLQDLSKKLARLLPPVSAPEIAEAPQE